MFSGAYGTAIGCDSCLCSGQVHQPPQCKWCSEEDQSSPRPDLYPRLSLLPGVCLQDASVSQTHTFNCYACHLYTKSFSVYFHIHKLKQSFHSKPNIYQCEEMTVFVRSCIEKMESMDPQLIASVFLAFLQRWALTQCASVCLVCCICWHFSVCCLQNLKLE